MSRIIQYNPNDALVPNRVVLFLSVANTPDYMGLPNTLINADVTGLMSVPDYYWKVVDDLVIEMTPIEKSAMDNFFKAKTFREKIYKIDQYDNKNKIIKSTYYDTDLENGEYTGLAEETVYVYMTTSLAIKSKVTTVYHFDGTEASTETYEYYKNNLNALIEKKI